MSENKTYTPFTAVTWDQFPLGLTRDNRPRSWMAECDLKYALCALAPHLTLKMCDVLVSAAASYLPIVLTWGDYTYRHDL